MQNKKQAAEALRTARENLNMSRSELVDKSGVRLRTIETAETSGNVSAQSWTALFEAVGYSFVITGEWRRKSKISESSILKLKKLTAINKALPIITKSINKGDLKLILDNIELLKIEFDKIKEEEFFNKFESGGIPIKPNRDHFKKSNK